MGFSVIYDESRLDDNVLEHHGIKGMKWGVRRTPEQLGHAPKKFRVRLKNPFSSKERDDDEGSSQPQRRQEPEPKRETRTNARKDYSRVSDDELARMIRRLQMEQQYAQLTAAKTSKGKQFVSEVLTTAGKQVATEYTRKIMTKATGAAFKQLGLDLRTQEERWREEDRARQETERRRADEERRRQEEERRRQSSGS